MAPELFAELAIAPVAGDVVDVSELSRLEGGTMQRVGDGQYGTAIQVQRPRSLQDVEAKVIRESELLGTAAFYGWGAGKDSIEGPSIKLANVLRNLWGNCIVRMEPVQDLSDCWVFTAAFIDMETGATLTRQFRQSKSSIVYGKHDEERKMDIRFQIGQSKATRNVILNGLPEWLIRRALEAGKMGVRKRIEAHIARKSIEHARDLVVSSLAKEGVSEDRIAAKMNRSTVAALTVDDLVTLSGDLRAIGDGTETQAAMFPESAPKSNAVIRDEMSKTPPNQPEPSDAAAPTAEPAPGTPPTAKPPAPPANETTTSGEPPSATPSATTPDAVPKNEAPSESEKECADLRIEWSELAKGFDTGPALKILNSHFIRSPLALKKCDDPAKIRGAVDELKAAVEAARK